MGFRLPSSTLRAAPLRSVMAAQRRTLTSSPRMQIKEDANRSGEEIEQKKQESLNKQKKGEGQWKEELGSASESHIAADREQVKDHDSHISKLQQETKNKGEKGEL